MTDTLNKRLELLAHRLEDDGGYVNANLVRTALERIDGCVAALKEAEKFIANGIELGFIRMPDADTPDPAHGTLSNIRAALSEAHPVAGGM